MKTSSNAITNSYQTPAFSLTRITNNRYQRRSLAQLFLYFSLPLIFLLLLFVRPPNSFYALPLISIAFAATLYEFVGTELLPAIRSRWPYLTIVC